VGYFARVGEGIFDQPNDLAHTTNAIDKLPHQDTSLVEIYRPGLVWVIEEHLSIDLFE
jgi:hypothetical protein